MEEVRLIEVKEEIMSGNKIQADELKELLKSHQTFLINLMSSPGAGKTTLISRTAEKIREEIKLAVLEADIDSKVDAEKLASQGISAVQLRTGGFCHLDANMVSKGLEAMDLEDLDLIVIENVGNLVCPAEFDTGANLNVMILSIPEGDDKPLKYPLMFTVSDVLILHKTDYLSLSDFNLKLARERALSLNPNLQIFEISSKTGEGLNEWVDWLKTKISFQNEN